MPGGGFVVRAVAKGMQANRNWRGRNRRAMGLGDEHREGSTALTPRRFADWVPGWGSLRRLRRVEGLARRIDHFAMGSNATYVGNNRVLVRVIAGEHALIFYVHADDKLLSPWLIANGLHEPDLTSWFVR